MSCKCRRCWYCEAPLSKRHEHDHMPLPQRHGGASTVPACVNCHDLKDRIPLSEWDLDVLAQAILACPPGPSRILLAKLTAVTQDLISRSN